jgi:hypothetical protein
VDSVGEGSSETRLVETLRAARAARLGKRVQVADVVVLEGSEIAWVHIHLPTMSESELLAIQEWVQTEFWAVEAERADDLILVPRFI